MYNQTIATTTSYSPDNAIIGYTVRVTSYQWFDFIGLMLVPLIAIKVIGFFIKK